MHVWHVSVNHNPPHVIETENIYQAMYEVDRAVQSAYASLENGEGCLIRIDRMAGIHEISSGKHDIGQS